VNRFLRWGKFNLVGAMGMVVQLGSLALLERCLPGRYLFASAAAVELAVLHNFVWHQHYTWRDRRSRSSTFARLARFHVSNGLVSMIGNLVLMRILVQQARFPLLISNLIAIVACSLINFCLSDIWAFAAEKKVAPGAGDCEPIA
jgi:putative flippase GtrA